jgi:hypothetical protein
MVCGGSRGLTHSRCAPLLEAFPAIDGPALRHFEGHGSLLATLRTNRSGNSARASVPLLSYATRCGGPFRLARPTPLGLILKPLIGVKELFSGGKHELRSAINALEDLVFVFHEIAPYALKLPDQGGAELPQEAAEPLLGLTPSRAGPSCVPACAPTLP